jgi:SAM-dependent methyltransferase
MTAKDYARVLRDAARFTLWQLRSFASSKQKFECPICGYTGPFMDLHPATGRRQHAKCPRCRALERHRLEYLAITNVLRDKHTSTMRMLHFAPEPCFSGFFRARFGEYETADLNMKNVDYNVDMRDLPFDDASYDFVLASIVLDYIPNDAKAISEVRRILRPHGIAVLPVAVVCEKTIEYSEPNPFESYHVRASGFDYFERYENYFSNVERVFSSSFPDKYQLFIFEDRTVWPNKQCPLRPAMPGERHINIVPICYV